MEAIQKRIKDSTEEILASSNADYDRVLKGMIVAYSDMLEIEPALELENIEEA